LIVVSSGFGYREKSGSHDKRAGKSRWEGPSGYEKEKVRCSILWKDCEAGIEGVLDE
jgi:hypothetical protein